MAVAPLKDVVGALQRDSFVALLGKLIGEAKYEQNNPPELIPAEDGLARHVLDALLPLSAATGGGSLVVDHVHYVEARGNLIVEYPGTVPDRVLSFVGCHMDVVTATDDWEFYPFSLNIDGDKLCGRATTDCLGHVALVTELIKRLGDTRPKLKSTVAINPLELLMEAFKEIQLRLYRDFPAHPKEKVYGFATPSTMKPTQRTYPGCGVKQMPAECTISGDVRLSPFYNTADVANKLQEYVDDINENVEKLDTRGPVSKYVLPEENLRGLH